MHAQVPFQGEILITGSTDGIGWITAKVLLERGYDVIIHGRNEARTQSAAQALLQHTGIKPKTIAFDLSALQNIAPKVEEIRARFPKLSVLVNNAGVYLNRLTWSADGFEMTFAVNVLAHFALTLDLIPLLAQNAPARIVHVASMVHAGAHIDWQDIHFKKRPYDPYQAYAQSKLANVLFSNQLAQRLEAKALNISSNALHPGVIQTKLLRAGFGSMGEPLNRGAETTVFAICDPSLEGVSGQYLSHGRRSQCSAVAKDLEAQQRLWALCESWTDRSFI